MAPRSGSNMLGFILLFVLAFPTVRSTTSDGTRGIWGTCVHIARAHCPHCCFGCEIVALIECSGKVTSDLQQALKQYALSLLCFPGKSIQQYTGLVVMSRRIGEEFKFRMIVV
uniref:Secreted protein n=1 Tax=Branchiostoma floridae TaxID=7739 RepID=C3YE04_BRAFL|eukprot:XP_002605469.1 hypothetical protein BRAFLDRAFT_74283 [Branchiostoma floridae]